MYGFESPFQNFFTVKGSFKELLIGPYALLNRGSCHGQFSTPFIKTGGFQSDDVHGALFKIPKPGLVWMPFQRVWTDMPGLIRCWEAGSASAYLSE